MTPEEYHSQMKMYVLIRKDILTDVQCGVQAAHAIQEYNILHENCESLKEWSRNHKTLIFLAASEKQLQAYKEMPIKHASFYEPDIGNIETAVAFEPITTLQGIDMFSKLKLI